MQKRVKEKEVYFFRYYNDQMTSENISDVQRLVHFKIQLIIDKLFLFKNLQLALCDCAKFENMQKLMRSHQRRYFV